MLEVDRKNGEVTHIDAVEIIDKAPIPHRREVEAALKRCRILHGSSIGKELDIIRRALSVREYG